MKKSRKLLMILGIVLSLAIATGSTLAYLTDTDSDVNVMTLGNVDIEQIEKEWNEEDSALQDFTQGKPLYPYVGNLGWENTEEDDGAYRRFTMENVVDKYVTVKNTGKSDAYVRTFIALEMGDYTEEEFDMIGVSINKIDGAEFDFEGAWEWTDEFVADIDGKNYYIMVAVHEDPVAPGVETIPSLLQVYLSKDADNEEVARLDGNGNGTYDILVFSEAVQTAGFANAKVALTEAFGDTSDPTRYHPWKEEAPVIPAIIYTYEELVEACEKGGSYALGANFDLPSYVLCLNGEKVSIDLNGHTLTSTRPAGSGNMYAFVNQTSDLNIHGEGTIISESGLFNSTPNTTTTINGGTFEFTPTNAKYHCYLQNDAKLIINDGTFTTSDESAALLYCINGFIEINGGFFQNTANPNAALLNMGNNLNYIKNQKITISGGTFVNWNPMSSAFARPWTNPDIPALIVLAEGCEIVEEPQDNGDIWYTVVKK